MGFGQIIRFLRRVWARRRAWSTVRPLSECFGLDRGHAICRYYLEQFLHDCAGDIRGHCLEFQGSDYTRAYGGTKALKHDVLHLDASNPVATIVADITKPNEIPSNQFDCIICTHVLHVILELDQAIAELYRILKPGGVLLVAAPHVSMCDLEWHELWRFTAEGLEKILARTFIDDRIQVRAYGNSLTAAGFLRGMVAEDFTPAELDWHDARFAVEICARAVK